MLETPVKSFLDEVIRVRIAGHLSSSHRGRSREQLLVELLSFIVSFEIAEEESDAVVECAFVVNRTTDILFVGVHNVVGTCRSQQRWRWHLLSFCNDSVSHIRVSQ